MDRGAHRDDLVEIDITARLLLEIVGGGLANDRQSRRPADKDDAVEIAHRQIRLLHGLVTDLEGPLDQVLHEQREFRLGDRVFDAKRFSGVVGQNVIDRDVHFVVDRQLFLGVLRGQLELLEGVGIVAGVGAVLGNEVVGQ